jgi:glycosyltransferase involved in cell wall biosynthesis
MIDYNEQRRRNQAIAQNGNDGYIYAVQDINDMVDELNETMAADLLADIICDMSDDDWHRFAHEILMRLSTDKEHDSSFIYDQLVERRLAQISNPEGLPSDA